MVVNTAANLSNTVTQYGVEINLNISITPPQYNTPTAPSDLTAGPGGGTPQQNNTREFTGAMSTLVGGSGLAYDAAFYGQQLSKSLESIFSAKALQFGSKASFFGGVYLTGYNSYQDYKTNKLTGLEAIGNSGWDIMFSGIGLVGGPLGWGISGGYFLIDNTIGWRNTLGLDQGSNRIMYDPRYMNILPVYKR